MKTRCCRFRCHGLGLNTADQPVSQMIFTLYQSSAESRADGLQGSVDRLKLQVDDLTRQLTDANSAKARLTQENFDLQHQVQELDSANAALAKAKSQLQASNDDLKRQLDDESRVRMEYYLLTNK